VPDSGPDQAVTPWSAMQRGNNTVVGTPAVQPARGHTQHDWAQLTTSEASPLTAQGGAGFGWCACGWEGGGLDW